MYPIDPISAKLGQIHFQGDVIPASWKDFIRHSNRPDPISMMILAHLVYWYRPVCKRTEDGTEVFYKKYKDDLLQKSYDQLENSLGFTTKQIRESLIRLEEIGLVKRHLRTIEIQYGAEGFRKIPNVLYIEIFPDKIEQITNVNLKKVISSFPTGKHPLPAKETPTSPQGKTNTETTPKTTPEIKGNVLDGEETLPFQDEKKSMGKTKHPLKKHLLPYYEKMKALDLGSNDGTLFIVIRECDRDNKLPMLDKAISHIQAERDKGTVFKKPPIALFRSVVDGKVSPISFNAKQNKIYAEGAKKKASWSSLIIKDKYVICEKTDKEIPLDRDPEEFAADLYRLFELSKNY